MMSNTLIVDLGNQTILFGVTGKFEPLIRISHWGTNNRILFNSFTKDREVTNDYNPFKRGIVTDWNNLEMLFERVFDILIENQAIISLSTLTVLLSYPISFKKEDLYRLGQIFFEKYNVEGLSLVEQPLATLFYNNRVGGIVVDCGAEIIQISYYDNMHPKNESKCVINKGGVDITNQFNTRFKASLCDLTYSVKQKLFSVSPNAFDVTNVNSLPRHIALTENGTEEIQYQISPDSEETIGIGRERFLLTEQFFQGFDSITNHLGFLRNLTVEANLYITGGNSLIKGFQERLKSIVFGMNRRVHVVGMSNAITSSFVGCNKYSQLKDFSHNVLHRDAYLNKDGMNKILKNMS